MLEDLIYELTDPCFALGFGGVVPAILLYVAISRYREVRNNLDEREVWGIGFLLLLAVGMPIVAVLLVFNLMSQTMIFVMSFCTIIQAASMGAIYAYFREVLISRHWVQTAGIVITSQVESRRRTPDELGYDDSDTEIVTSPLVEYEFTVNGQTFRNRKIALGVRTSEYELESILDRYPAGAHVTVYYNPADPNQAVLERDVPKSMVWLAGVFLLLPFGVPLGAMWAYHRALEWITPNGGLICISSMGAVTLLFGVAHIAVCVQASRWPKVRGRIVSSGAEAFEKRADRYRHTYFKPSVVYEYEVNGRKYLGDRVRIAVVVSSTIPGLAGLMAANYPVGREVDVYYNPKKPSESVLHPWSAWVVVPWLLAAGLGVLVWALSGSR